MNYKNIYYTAVKTGICRNLQAWLELIAEKDFCKPLMFMDVLERQDVAFKFVERKKRGLFVEG